MLENRKNVRKIIAILMAIIAILGVFINLRNWPPKKTEISTIPIEEFGKAKSSLKLAAIDLDDGIIIPMYKPQWEKVSSTLDATNKKITIVIKGYAYKSQDINSDVSIDYGSNVTSTLAPEDITLFIDGTKVTSTTKPKIEVSTATTSTNGTSQKTEVTHTITISEFEEATRNAGIPYKEWSGNISLKIAGRGKESTTYNANVLKDEDGNQNMMETDEGQTEGTWIDVTFEDTATNQNTNGVMFADFTNPELTYKYSGTSRDVPTNANPEIDYTNKKLIVVFDVIDKYFKEAKLDADDITVSMTDYTDEELQNAIEKDLALKTLDADVTEGNITYKTNGDIYYDINGDGTKEKIGERYQLEITKLEQAENDGFKFSGYMSLSIPAGQASSGTLTKGIMDKSGNLNTAKTITIGIDEEDGKDGEDVEGDGVIVDVVDPVWEKLSSSATSGEIIIRARDKYLNSIDVDSNDITVYTNGVASTVITKQISLVRYVNITEDASGNEVVTQVADINSANGVEYKVTLGNVTLNTEEYDKFIPKNHSELVLDEDGGARYRKENGGAVEIEIAAGIVTDDSGNTNKKSSKFEVGNLDSTKPQVYDIKKTEDETNDKLTFVFNVTDRNYNPDDVTNLIEKNEMTLWVDGVQISNDKITSLTYKEIQHESIDGVVGKVLGHQYTVVVEDFVETDEAFTASGRKYRDLSGTVQIKIAETAAKDKNGNTLNPDTTTIGEFIDYIKPEIQKVTVTNPKNTTDKTYTMSFKVLDKYIDETNLVAPGEITVYVDGQEASSITKNLTSTPITASCKKTVNGVITEDTHTVGHTYTLVLGGFEQTELQDGKSFMEWSGTVSIQIAQNAVNDKDGATNTAIHTLDSAVAKRTVAGDHVDFIKPVVEKVSSERGTNTEIIYFNVIDKYLDTTDLVDKETEIKVYVDGVETTDLTKALTRVTANDVTATVNSETRTVSQQYKLELSGFEQTSRNANGFKDWSGTVSIELVETAVKDTSNNNLATEVAKRTITGDFVDFIKPDLKYTHQSTDINTGTKKYTMTFDVTDNYYSSGELALTDLTIKMQNGQKDANGNPIIYDLNALDTAGTIDLELTATPIYLPVGVKYTNSSGSVVEATAAERPQIGHTYTLTVSNLEKLEIESGLTTANYSGIVTVAVPANIVKDKGPTGNGTSQNGNSAKTITSGLNIPTDPGDGSNIANGTAVDVVDPLWTKVSSSAAAIDPDNTSSSKATLTIKGTDTYLDVTDSANSYDDSTLTSDEIEIYVNGSKVEITPTIGTVTKLEETRTSGTVQYGVQYTISFTGFAQNANQVKVRILKDAIKDQTGNGNKQTDFIVYNVLKTTASERDDDLDVAKTKTFLGESVATTIYPEGVTSITAIQRQDIEKVIFINSTANSKASGVQRVWDVSAQGDDSIIAWTSQTTAPYTVYIGSDSEIFANQNSTALFSCIGYGESCTATTVIESKTESTTTTDLSLLNTSSVTNMRFMFSNFGYRKMTTLKLNTFDTSNVQYMDYMFNYTGHNAMQELNLGSKFDTSNVKGMQGMFFYCGYTAMTSLDLSSATDATNTTQFNTSNVTNMSEMFNYCGYIAMTTLNLGNNFNTGSVTNMYGMFWGCGFTAMTSLDLGNKFYTTNVENMQGMFGGCGYTAMTSLKLGDYFDTSNVKSMALMFNGCGRTKMTSLDLGDKFDTSNVTNMYRMFFICGEYAMTILDLGPRFTKIPNGTVTMRLAGEEVTASANDSFAGNCGVSNAVIYAPESIYKNKNAFKLNSTDTTDTTDDLKYTTGTINPIYRPQWEKVSSEFDNATAPTQLKVNIKGTANHTETLASGKVKINYDSTVTTNLTANDFQVYINGELDGDLNKNGVLDAGETPSITKALTSLNPNTGLTEATHTLTLSGFEQTARQTGVPFKEWSGNISIRIGGRGEATSTYTANELVDIYGNQSMMQTDETGTWVDVIYKDADSTTNVNTSGTMFIDTIKPEFTYKSSETTVGDGNHGDTKKVTIIFDVVDKYFKETQLSTDTLASLITVKLYDDPDANVNGNITKKLEKVDDITYTVNGVEDTKIGEKYKLEITGLDKGDGFTYSGPMTIAFPDDIIEDKSGNKNSGTTITIRVDETDGNPNETAPTPGENDEVDVVDPVWEKVSSSTETGEITIRAKDKYFASSSLSKDKITVIINEIKDGDTDADGVVDATPTISKSLSDPTYKKLDANGNYVTTTNIEEAVAVEYTLTLGNIMLDNAGVEGFKPKNANELVVDENGYAYYRKENGGKIEIQIDEGVIVDDSGNKNNKAKFEVGTMDSTKPEVYDIQKIKDEANGKVTFIFNVTDRNYDPSNLITLNVDKDGDGNVDPEISVWLDGEQISNNKISSFTYKEIQHTKIDGVEGKVLGHQYTLVLNNLVETNDVYKTSTREYRELSGTVEIKIVEDAANDNNGNELNTDTTTIGQFVDYIKPELTYQYVESSQEVPGDINYEGKTFTMVFDITDKYFNADEYIDESTLTINDLIIKIDGETIDATTGVNRTLSVTDIKKTFNKTLGEDTDGDGQLDEGEDINGNGTLDYYGNVQNGEYVVGKRYTLKLSNLEQLEILTGKHYLDYSGVVEVTVPQGKVKDLGVNGDGNTPHVNAEKVITSGKDIKGDLEDTTKSSVIVDVVDPFVEMLESSAYGVGQTATAKIRITDKYLLDTDSTLTGDDIQVVVNGSVVTEGITKTLEDQTHIKIDANGNVVTTENVAEAIGVEYKVTINGFVQNANQVKIRVVKDAIKDDSLNGNKQTDLILYNVLKSAASESEETSAFLGESVETTIYPEGITTLTSIRRNEIERVVFVNSTADSTASGVKRVWDVSAQGDDSIIAWTSNTSAPYTIYIGSDYEIFANQNSQYLFQYIGYAGEDGDYYTVTEAGKETITNLEALNVSSVTNMAAMFQYTGYTAMTSLDLGSQFDTSNVNNMKVMFSFCGYMAMETLELRDNFDTSKVTDMSGMFAYTGYMKMTNLDLSSGTDSTNITQFNTSSVTDMRMMFLYAGFTKMQSLNLGNNFNTQNVTDMFQMFMNVGNMELTKLDLGSKFDTKNVTNMGWMFREAGATKMTTLNLGKFFDTSNVTGMIGMFNATGRNKMTSLDLGDKFDTRKVINMAGMFRNTGNVSMTSLDLGPMFTKIPEGIVAAEGLIGTETCNANEGLFIGAGKQGCTIYVPESIYSSRTSVKTNTDSTTTISLDITDATTDPDTYRGTINPIYKPEWEHLSTTVDVDNKAITIEFKGYANEQFTIGNTITDPQKYLSAVTSSITAGSDASNLLTVKIDGEVANTITKTVTAVSVTENEVQYTVKLSGFEENARQADKNKNFLEWTGNIAIQPVKGTLVDIYGNKNMISIDDENGNWLDIEFRDAAQDAETGNWIDDSETEDVNELRDSNTAGAMFTDYIKPEFTYVYSASNPSIEGDPNNKVTIIFDVTDKYFKDTAIDKDEITVIVDEDEDVNTSITKTLTKKEDLYYTVNGVSQKVGERYELVINGLESENGVGYSGPLTLVFPAGSKDENGNLVTGIIDKSGNLSNEKTITMGIDEPEEGEDEEIVVDVVNPVWSYATSDIDRTNNEVNIYIIGSDKYYKEDTLTKDKITVYVDNSSTTVDTDRDGTADGDVTKITKTLTDITAEMQTEENAARLAELIAGAGLTDLMTEENNLTDVGVIYKLTLSTFGTISGETKVVLPAETIVDESGNSNIDTTIEVGNVTWTETGDNSTTPRYPAFRNDIVDFINPVINYTYSTVEIDTDGDGVADSTVSANPDIDYTQKQVTVKFTVTDKYLLGSDLIKTTTDTDGNTIQIPKNINIVVGGTTVYDSSLETQTTQVTTSISVANIANGKEYTIVVSNLQQQVDASTNTTPENGNGFDFSGPMDLVFAAGAIDDTSGNKNAATTISLDTHVDSNGDSDVVDVVDPIIKYSTSSIDRTNETVTLYLRAEDKYLSTETLSNAEGSVKVKVVDEYGNVIVNDTTTITRDITRTIKQSTYMIFTIELSEFTVYEGKTSVIIPAGVIKDASGNGNVETEILVGNAEDITAFKDGIVDFTKTTWEYVTSTIDRDWDENDRRLQNGEDAVDGTVTLEVKGTDIYFDNKYFNDEEYQLDLSTVKVYDENDVELTDVQINFAKNDDDTIKKEYIEEEKELATEYSRALKGVKYTLVLSNFGTYEGPVKIKIPENAIKDTSNNGNILTQIDVGNESWIETDVETDTENPKYTAFRSDIVDFIKPVIKYQYEENVNPKLDRTNETVDIIFTVTDTYFLESNIGLEDMKIYIDNMQVYGTGTNANLKINAEIVETVAIDNGLKYTLRLSSLEENGYIEDLNGNEILDEGEDINGNGQLDTMYEMFERHSGVIKLVIAEDQVFDSSGNPNNETTLIIDNSDGDSQTDGVIVDFVNPNIYFQDKYVNWEDGYALITLRATDRFYDTSTELKVENITLYEEVNGQNVNITEQFKDNIIITKSAALTDANGNIVGYDYTIKITEFDEEFEMKINIPAGIIGDTSGNYNDAYGVGTDSNPDTSIDVVLDNKKPSWKYVSTNTSNFETSGAISFTVDGVDKYLDVDKSDLKVANIKVLKDGQLYLDGTDSTDATKITVNYLGTNTAEEADLDKYERYQIDVTGLTEMGTYSLVFEKETLVDTYNNKSAATTISFSNSVIASNTGNYVNVTYHVTPDMEIVHSSYVHELMSVNTTGTNFENTTYRPSTLGELFNNGENPLFAEPMYVPSIDGYTIEKVYSPKSFAGWAEADSDGNAIEDGTVYGLYDEIPKTVTHLKAVWQDAKVIFVSSTNGDNSNNGREPTRPVKDLATAYTKLDTTYTADRNIIVIMDSVEYDSTATLTGNATITSVYAGVDYRKDKNAELKISSNMIVNGDITFDNIKLYTTDTTVSNGTDYLGNGTYKNMLISNYSGDIIIGRGVTTPTDKYTFGAIVGGNFATETSTGELGTHTIRVEAGKYNNIIAGSTLSSSTTTSKSITHKVVIGNMKDAAVSRNDKLTITGYVAIGENEKNCYPTGAITTQNASTKNYADVTIYSGTITGANKFTKATENSAIYLRSINGSTDGMMNFEMFGGVVQANIYGGARVSSVYESDIFNTMKFYGGNLSGNIFGQSANDSFTGSSEITLQGNFSLTGNVFGGPNVTTTVENSVGKGNSTIIINSSSTTINGNIYGGGNITTASDAYVTGNTNITLKAGTVSSVYGSGYNCGNTGTTNITIENGVINGKIFGGAYQNQARTISNITVLGGTVKGNIYGGNENVESQLEGDTYFQNVNITIGDTDTTTKPTVNGTIYGGGKYDKVDVATINLLENEKVTSVYGGSDVDAMTVTANIYLKGITVNEIYGGGQSAGTVAIANIYLQSGTATDVYGGGFAADVTESNISLEGTATATNIYGGSNTSGTVTTSNVTLKSGTATNVFGGGNSAAVGTANVTLDGTILGLDTIHGGSKDAGVTTTTNVTLKSGTVTNVFGGGLDVGATTTNVKQQGATVTNIYGGNNSGTGNGGDTGTTNVEIVDSTVEDVYGGNKEKGTTRYANITIHGASTITGKLYGGGYKSAIGKGSVVKDEDGNITVTVTEEGSTTINIAGGTIKGDINGGSELSTVYGNTNINIGKDATDPINSNLTAGNINIIGTIYGAGDTLTEGEVTVAGNTKILMDNNETYPITYLTADGKEKSVYGSGNGGAIYSNGTTTDKSTIHIKDFGTSTSSYLFKSIEDTGDLYIGNSVIELSGALEEAVSNTEVGHYYTLNTITNALTIYSNTTLYTQRGFNKVGGFNSYVNQTSTRANVTIDDSGVASTNADNKLYTLEGINLIFAKEEVNLSNKATITQSQWGKVNGIAFFGTYKNTSSGKQYDLDLFRAGTYVEGLKHSENNKQNGDGSYTNGFYTTVADEASGGEIAQLIDTVNYTNYTDWIINAPTINYDVDLVASTYGKQSVAELVLDYKYASDYTYLAETVYTLNQVSSNALKPDVQIVDSTELATISSNANNTFGLTMETTKSGWKQQALTNLYSADNGSYSGDSVYESDAQAQPGTIKFKIHNSINITEERDLGNINIVLTGQQPISGSGTEAYTFKVVIAVNMQTILDDLKNQYTPSFTDKKEVELSYTSDSRVDLSYVLYNNLETTPYASGDYRVISTTEKLPAGTTITVKDYGQGDTVNKVYYYHVTGNETETDGTRYLYRLSNFIDMGSTDSKYVDSSSYYHSDDKYVFEKYDISIDFIDSNISTDKLAQETYLELRNSSGTVKYNNGDTTIKYNLYSGKNATITETIVTAESSYSVVDTLEIPIKISASILEQSGILDTKYHDQIAGIAIQIVGGNERIKSPELQNFKLTNTETGEEYPADANGVIRMPIIQGLGSMTGDYILSITQANVPSGLYTAQVRLYTADDGKYYGTVPEVQRTFNITFISGATGQVAVLADYDTRIINKSTGVNLVENAEVPKAVDMTIKVGAPTDETNIRVELYKRKPTYTSLADETTYTGTTYELVDITQYLEGTEEWQTAEENGLITTTGSKEYMVLPMQTYETEVDVKDVEFEKTLIDGISTGEYKLVFKVYNKNTLVQELRKTFIVTP